LKYLNLLAHLKALMAIYKNMQCYISQLHTKQLKQIGQMDRNMGMLIQMQCI